MSTASSCHTAIMDAGGLLDPSKHPSPIGILARSALTIAEELRDGVNERSNILWPIGELAVIE